MSKKSEISKHLDPSINRQGSTGEPEQANENGLNGHDQVEEPKEDRELPESKDQASQRRDTSDSGTKEDESKPQAPNDKSQTFSTEQQESSIQDAQEAQPQMPKENPELVSTEQDEKKTQPQEVIENPELASTEQKQPDPDEQQGSSIREEESKPQAPNDKSQSSSTEQEGTSIQEEESKPQAPVEKNQEPVTGDAEPATSDPQPVTSDQGPATSDPQPVTSDQEPATSDPQSDTSQPEAKTTSTEQEGTSIQDAQEAQPQMPKENPELVSTEQDEKKTQPQEVIENSEIVSTEQKQPETEKQQPTPPPWESADIKKLDKPEAVKLIELLVKENDPIQAEKVSRKLKSRYEVIHKKERAEALEKFVADGNEADHFAYKFDELDNRFDGAFKLLRDKKQQFARSLEKSKEKNLEEKVTMLEELRALVDEEETTSSIHAVKQIQDKWKAIGPVPGQHAKTLWANYHALMDRYYDQRSIYFELKELDRKKNLEAKIELCEKAEKLVDLENLKQAITELNELHEEFKHIGPVPKEDQQALWERFKGASDQVYARRKEFVKHLKQDLHKNLLKKKELAEEVQPFKDFDSKRINDWNKKTREVLDLQKKWEAIGGLPREHAKEVNKRFWGAFKSFFHNKSMFFKQLEGERVANLQKKQELVEEAVRLKDSSDWNQTAEKLKALQKQWREIGPVPEKQRNAIYQQFKEACDVFFNNLRSQNQVLEKEYIENLKQKQKICVDIETMTAAKDFDLDRFLDLKQQFDKLGYVPANEVKNIRSNFAIAANDFLAAVPSEMKEEARQIKYDIQFEKLKKGPNSDRKIEHKGQALRREINSLENDIATWKNNLEFFANSKTADKLKEEFTVKIDQAVKKLKELKSQLRAIREL